MLSVEDVKKLSDAYKVEPKNGADPILGRVVKVTAESVTLGEPENTSRTVWKGPTQSFIDGEDAAARYVPISLERAAIAMSLLTQRRVLHAWRRHHQNAKAEDLDLI